MPFDMSARIESWRAKLLDTGRRNRLIQFRAGLTGGVRLLHPPLPDLWQRLVVGREVLAFPWQRHLLGEGEEPAETPVDDADEPDLPADVLTRCQSSARLGAADLLTDLSDRRLASRLTRLATNARESLSEKGVTTLYVALGFLRWFETPGGEDELRSPLVLAPVVLERDSVEAPWEIQASDEEILPNHSLIQRLKADFNLTVPVPPEGCFDGENPAVAREYLAALTAAVRHHERWQVLPECALGVFNFQKLAMWEDLGRNRARITSHELCRKIGGDALPLSAPVELPAEGDLDDRLHPRQTFSILDADSSQQAAVLAAARGVNLIVDGPPGTGKSQAIANIIAEFLATGRTVLFVSEKAAALEVVKRRLDRAGLGDFCLELHSARASKRDVLAELGRCLDLAQERAVDGAADLQALYEVRQQLNAYARALHEVRPPLGLSPFQVHGELAQLPKLETRSRSPIASILTRDRDYVRQAADLLAGLPACQGVLDARGKHAWRDALPGVWSEAVHDEVRFHLRRLTTQFPAARAAADMLAALGLCSPQPTRPEWWTALANGQRMLESPAWQHADQRAVLHAACRQHAQHQATMLQLCQQLGARVTAPAFESANAATVAAADRARSWLAYLLRPLTSFRAVRAARAWFTAAAQPKFWDEVAVLARFHAEEQANFALIQVHHANLLLDPADAVDWARTDQLLPAAAGADFRQQLNAAVQANRRVLDDGFRESWDFLTTKLFAPAAEVSTGIVLDRTPLPLLQDWLAARADDAPKLAEWLAFRGIRQGLQALDLLPLLNELTAGELRSADAVAAFHARFYQLWLDAVGAQTPPLQQFTSAGHDRSIQRFHDLDRKTVAHAAHRIRHQLLTSIRDLQKGAAAAPASSELGLLHHEVNKKRRHLPLRKLFAQVPTLLPRLKPCLMMSPLAVSTFLEAGEWTFDVVIFDEASQVLPQDAIGAIYRGKQLIVAGDQRQLPPTDFFQRTDGEDEDSSSDGVNLGDYESILDVCCGIPLTRRRLRWHYRSRREALIAFSNRHFYDDELVTFPSAADSPESPAIRLEFVTEGRWKPNAGVNPVEAARAAAMIVAHFRAQPERSLGVIALNQAQQMRILDELEKLRRREPDLEDCFAADAVEPFFVKNLENVQGDERDVIFLCVGYGRDDAGTLRLNFGPLNRQGGERRLNVAVTRARWALTVLSSLRAQDIDLNRAQSAGARLLRAYLDYAERGPASLGAASKENQRAAAPFEAAVAAELAKQGFEVRRQVGCGGQPIDLAVVDPRTPGRYLLGIECDGVTYQSFMTARDRDRLRQEVLHGLGWHLCRVWSTDWVRQRDGQLQRIQAAYERAQANPQPPAPPPPAPLVAPKAKARSAPEPEMAKGKAPRAVDEAAVQQSILVTLDQIGATAPDDLAPAIARQLGFKRTSKQLQEKVEQSVNTLLASEQLRRTADGRLQRSKPGGGR